MNIRMNDVRGQKLKEIEEFLQANPKNNFWVYGTGQYSQMISGFLNAKTGINIAGYVVSDAYYTQGEFFGKPVHKASAWMNGGGIIGDWCYIAVGDRNAAEQITQALPAGIKICDTIYTYSCDNADYLDSAFFTANRAKFQKTYDKLQDDISKQTMTAYIETAIGGDTVPLEKLCGIERQYFNDLTKSLNVECFVDCGAFDGDTIVPAIDFYGDRLKRIVAFEPDQENIKKLRANMAENGISSERVQVVQKGSWSEETVLRFSSGRGTSSRFDSSGDIEIPVDSIDHVLAGAKVDLIKMDIEGSEAEALRGAAAVIRTYRPALAICVYHRPSDLFVIPELIEELAGKGAYRYYLRHYPNGLFLTDLILYAIPA